MKTVIETLTIDPEKYDLTRIAPLDQLLFVDIETTGFSAGSSSLYEIGCIRFENNIPKLIQFFAEDTTEEKEVLSSFFDLCHPSGTLIHFNGNTFDIPYMKAKARQYGLFSPFETMEGVDIYKRIMPYKDILGLPNCKQKTIEEFLGISREDQYNGGQLIDIYKEYCRQPSEESEKLLILHNNEDMKGMLKLLPILTYSDIFMQPFRVVKVQANHFTNVDQSAGDEVLMKLRFSSAFPIPFSMHKAGCHFSANDNEGFLKVPLFKGELKYFYSNYRDYYYLPLEDIALHKAVAGFVDKDHRKQAKASNCYTRKESDYLPQWDIIFEPIFKKSYEDKLCYFELTEDMKKQPESFRQYALHILDMMAHARNMDDCIA